MQKVDLPQASTIQLVADTTAVLGILGHNIGNC